MIRKIRSLGLAFAAIAMTGLFMSGAAHGSELHATSPFSSVSIFGQSSFEHVFNTTAGSVRASQATFEATATDNGQDQLQTTAQELTVTATYSGVQAFGLAGQVLMNGCKYTVTNTQFFIITFSRTAYVDITGCTVGKQIEIKTAICTITVPEQNGLGFVTLTNDSSSSPHDVRASTTITGIKYENHGALCPNYGGSNTAVRTDGQYSGAQTTFQARLDVGSEPVTQHSHSYSRLIQSGALVGLLAT